MLNTRYFNLNIERAGYIVDRTGDNEGPGWTAREYDYDFDCAGLPSPWANNWVMVDRDSESVGVFVDRDVLVALIGRNASHMEWAFSFGGKRFYDVVNILPDIVWHASYPRRNKRELKVAERNASLLCWLLEFYRDGTGVEVLDACKLVGDEFDSRCDAIRACVDYTGTGAINETVVLA